LTATFAVTVDDPADDVVVISNTASIADDGNNGTDPNTGDNSASDTTPVGSLVYYTITPCRLFDTRDPAGPYGAPSLQANSERTFTATGVCGVPAGAVAIAANMTVTNPTALGFLRTYRAGTPAPFVSTLNYSAGQTRANNDIIALDSNGDFVVQCIQSSGTADGVLDINGYFLRQ